MSPSLHEAALQTVITGIPQTHPTSDELRQIAHGGFGGFILFARNAPSLHTARALTDGLRAAYPPENPPLILVDQEGGRVARLRAGVEAMPSMMALGATADVALARRAGARVAFDLRRAGCTLDCAPVLDLAVDPDNTTIGTRSLGSDPSAVVGIARAFVAGLESGGIVAAPKHFPGHGATGSDSHVDLPVVHLSQAQWRERDLLPFAALAPAARAMMTAHVVLRALDANRPATLSHRLLTTVLRDELRFAGACLTDCMHMGAIAGGVGTARGAALAIAAGADGVLVSHSPELAQEAAACIARDVAPQRVREAAGRMRALRSAAAEPLPLHDTDAADAGIGREIARRAVTLVNGASQADAAQCVVLSFEGRIDDGAADPHERPASLAACNAALAEEVVPLTAPPERLRAALSRSKGRRPIVLMRHARRFPEQAEAIATILRGAPDAVVVAVRDPFDLACVPGARHALATYGDEPVSLRGLADVLFDGARAVGVLPVELHVAR